MAEGRYHSLELTKESTGRIGWHSLGSRDIIHIIQFHIVLGCLLFVPHLTLHMPAHHQLLHNDSDDGTQERRKDGHHAPAVPFTVEKNRFTC